MADRLDAEALQRWCVLAAQELLRLATEINTLNVFPVADADTGTNMSLTMAGVARAVRLVVADGAGLPAAAAAMSNAALTDARGNSGIILSQWLGGVAEVLSGRSAAGPADLADSLERGRELAYVAVGDPVEGTMLSVATAAAAAARHVAVPGTAAAAPGLAPVAFAAAEGGADELARSPLRLRALARAGVIDAGGRGLVAVLASLVQAITGELPDLPQAAMVGIEPGSAVAVREVGSELYRHEVCYLLDAGQREVAAEAQEKLAELHSRLRAIGDSVVIAGTGGLWRVHVHVNDVAAALAVGQAVGEAHRVSVSRLVPAASRQSTSGRPDA